MAASASRMANKNAAKARDLLAQLMRPADVSKAQRMAREWLAKHGAEADGGGSY